MMFDVPSLSRDSVLIIRNIHNVFLTHPNYIGYEFDFYEDSGCVVFNIKKEGRIANMYRFYAKPLSGEIGSIAIYGRALEGHFKTISHSKIIFGLVVEDIELVTTNTIEPFVDITLI